MTSSDHPLIPTSAHTLTDCVYLIPGAGGGGRFKLGMTSRLAARVASLRQSDGPLDLDRAVVIAARDRRAAFDLEGVLRTVFNAPAWRIAADAPACNGSSEWYDLAAFEPMVALVSDMIERDERCGVRRFALERRAPWLAEWCGRARVVRRVRRWSEEELRAENARLLAQAEANFERLREWLEARRELLVEVRPSVGSGGACVRRVFVFEGDEHAVGDEGLAATCLVSRRHAQGVVTFGYLGSAGPDAGRSGGYGVEFVVTEAFEQARGFSPELDALLTRIEDWICREAL